MPDVNVFAPIGTSRTVEMVIAQVEGRVLDGTFKVGEMLPSEEQLATQLGVGRRSVREALKVLEAKGLLEIRMGVGAIVKRNDLDSFLDVLTRNVSSYFSLNRADREHVRELRAIMEGAALERLLKAPDSVLLMRLEQNLAHQREALARGDTAEYQRWHLRFHCDLIDSMHNPVISMIYKQTLQLIQSAMGQSLNYPGVMARSIDQHAQLLTALGRQDREELHKVLEQHLEAFLSQLDRQEEAGAVTVSQPVHE